MTHILRLVPVCASSTELPYHMLCFELKVFITTYTCLFFYCDDMIEAHPDVIGRDLDFFALKYAQPGHTFADGLLQAWLHLIATETRAWYCPTLASFIVTSTLEYLGGAMIESTVARRMTVPRSAPRFAKYLRVKTGNGSAYSAMLFPAYRFADEDALLDAILPMFPDFMELLDGCNDVMSFYKESVVGDETSNYFMVQARSREISPTAVVREGIARQVLLMTDSTATLERNRDVQAAFVEFMEGYLMWHGTASRYRLKELGIRLGPQEEPKFVAV
ncbi:isoprenoid synthase domain-containing protein [Geopyxis carbonaria]|nr:isoprenoid synthase domain-containing protein [Geopyxis carbonaria]